MGINSRNAYKKKFSWTTKEEQMLINYWKYHNNQLKKCRRNKHIYVIITNKLINDGLKVTYNEVINKIRNLSQKYRREKTSDTFMEWPLFNLLDSFLGDMTTDELPQEDLKPNVHEKGFTDCSSMSSTPSPMPQYNATQPVCEVSMDLNNLIKTEDNLKTNKVIANEEILLELKQLNNFIEFESRKFSHFMKRSNDLSERTVAALEKSNEINEKLFKFLNEKI